MRQAWNIFVKDFLHLRLELANYLGTILVSWWLSAYNVPVTELLVMFTGSYLIAQLIHADAVVGDCQFWLTRPYRWSSLLAAKLFFIFALVCLPVFFAQWVILSMEAFPFGAVWRGLLWEQFLLFGISSFVAALAALTPGLASFIGVALAAGGIAVAIAQVVQAPEHSLHSSDWVRESLGFIVLATVAAVVLSLQYRKRHTARSRMIAFYLLAAGIVAYVFLPWSAAFAIQERFSSRSSDSSSVRISLAPAGEKWALAMENGKRVQVALPMVIAGVPEVTRLESLDVGFRASNGRHAPLTKVHLNAPQRVRDQSRDLLETASCELDRNFFEAERDHPVTLRGTLFLTLFGNSRTHTIPLPRSWKAVDVTDRLRCIVSPSGIVCASPFRWPNQWIESGATAFTSFNYALSYSPFPASLGFFPFDRRWSPQIVQGAKDIAPESAQRYITVHVTEPVAYIRRDFEIPDVHLSDVAVPWRSRWVLRDGRSVLENEY